MRQCNCAQHSANRAKHARSGPESTKFVDRNEEQPELSRSPRCFAGHPVPPPKKSAKQAATSPSVANKTPSLGPTGEAPAAEATRFSKVATAHCGCFTTVDDC